MSVISKLATSLNRRDEIPNQELAKQIVKKDDKKAVQELIEHLNHKDKNIQSDCIKVLYEIGDLNPKLIAEHYKTFITLLNSKNNRLVWGAMTAISSIALEVPKNVYQALPKILNIADKGSVISRDYAVNILIKLCSIKEYQKDAFDLLIEQLKIAPTNQLPMYAENAVSIVTDQYKSIFVKTLTNRLDDIEKETKRKRVEKVIKKVK